MLLWWLLTIFLTVPASAVDTTTSTSLRQDTVGTARVNHRVSMLFPLLLGISGRLATLLPAALTAVVGVFLFVAFSKKAFVISLIALVLTYLDKYKKRGHTVIHLHKFDHHEEEEEYHSYYPLKKHKSWTKPWKKAVFSHSSAPQDYTFYPRRYESPKKHHDASETSYNIPYLSEPQGPPKQKRYPTVTSQVNYSKSDSYARNPYGAFPPDSSYLSQNSYGPYPSYAAYSGQVPEQLLDQETVESTNVPADFQEFLKVNVAEKDREVLRD